ncbi:hypothetical protein K1719_022814 [Acacia pycnantha]|nr:hypothetical protein K1719_022814 [Acacia pycnantha]
MKNASREQPLSLLAMVFLLKVNQVGTVTEIVEVVKQSKDAHWGMVVSHRSDKSPFSDHPVHPKYLHEDEELSQQCKDHIATLPTESGWINVQLHQYNCFWFAKRHLQGILSCQNHFHAQDSDILLVVTTPKSGTTWLKALAFARLFATHLPYLLLPEPV